MLYRFTLVTSLLLLSFSIIAAPDVEEAMNRAQQQTDEMRGHTDDVFNQAKDLSTSQEFLEGISKEANRALQQAGTVPKQSLPNFSTLTDQQLQQARDDINRLLDQAQGHPPETANPMEQKSGPQLYVFVSFSMPDITLKRLLIQAARIDASLILRGLVDDNMGKTKDKITQLMEADEFGHTKINGGFAIDPTLFQRFDITQVPAFVLTSVPVARCDKAGCPSTDYVRLYGDATIEYVLETMAREAPASMQDSAQTLLVHLREGSK